MVPASAMARDPGIRVVGSSEGLAVESGVFGSFLKAVPFLAV
jgi:hypothetical protein